MLPTNFHISACTFADIQVKEPDPESLTKKVKTYLPPRFMSVKEAATQLMELVRCDMPKSMRIFIF